jgi:urease accessory protein
VIRSVERASAPSAASAHRVGRDGALSLTFERRGVTTVLCQCRSTLPLQALAPLALDDPASVVSILNPTGGVLGGDRLAIDVTVGARAHACLTTPSATRVYRTSGEPALQTVRLGLGSGAVAEWVPDHTIPSAGARYRQVCDVEVAEGATLVLVDGFSAGRVARDEAWRFALLDSTLRVRDPAGWLVIDRFVLGGDPRWSGPGFTEGRPYFATLVVVADRGLDAFCADVTAALPTDGSAIAGAAPLPRRAVLVRVLASTAHALTTLVGTLWGRARQRVLDLPPLDLRKL